MSLRDKSGLMTNSVSNIRLQGISGFSLELSHWKALEMRLTDWGWRKVGESLVMWVLSSEAPGKSALLCPLAGPRHSRASLLWSQQSTFRQDVVSCYHIKKQLSIVSKSRGSATSLPGGSHILLLFSGAILGHRLSSLPDLWNGGDGSLTSDNYDLCHQA